MLNFENREILEKLKKLVEFNHKGKNEASILQLELEEKLDKSQKLLISSIEKYDELERNLVYIREYLNKPLK